MSLFVKTEEGQIKTTPNKSWQGLKPTMARTAQTLDWGGGASASWSKARHRNRFDLLPDERVEEGRTDEEADAAVEQGAQDAVEVDQRRRVNKLPLDKDLKVSETKYCGINIAA